MNVKSKQTWFRFHLSTIILTVLLFGTMITLNFRPKTLGAWKNGPFGDRYIYDVCSYGWPIEVFRVDMRDYLGPSGTLWTNGLPYSIRNYLHMKLDDSLWTSGAVHTFVLNVVVCSGVCITVAILLEWQIRRREAPKT